MVVNSFKLRPPIPNRFRVGFYFEVATIDFVLTHILGQKVHLAFVLNAPYSTLNWIERSMTGVRKHRKYGCNINRATDMQEFWHRE